MDKKGLKVDEGLAWSSKILAKKKAYVYILAAAQIVNSSAAVCFAVLMRDLIDAASSGNSELFKKSVVLIILLVLFQIAVGAFIRWISEFSRAVFENVFKQRLFHEILTKDFVQVKKIHSAEWVNRLSTDSATIADGYVDIFPGFIGMAVKLIFAVYMIIRMDKRFALLLMPGIFFVMFFSYVFRQRLKELNKNVRGADGRIRVFFQERIGSLLAVRSFSAEENEEALAGEKADDHMKARMARNRFSNICRSGFSFAIQGLYLFGLIYCSSMIMKGKMTYGTLAAIIQLISQIQSPFANISGYLPKYYALIASADRIREIDDFDDDMPEGMLDIDAANTYYKDSFNSLSLNDVSFTYQPVDKDDKDDAPISVKNVDLSVFKGEYIAFTGESGCGKSTVLKLMMSLYRPDEGECVLNSEDGNKDILSSKYRRLFAYVPQGNMLMNGSIKDIITFSSKYVDEERLDRALKVSCADEFITKLEKGIDTVIFESGSGLSEGQMQRLAIARAVYSEHPILLLDECTSALDSATEAKLLENLKAMQGRTVIIVTHRSAALSICDRVLEFTKQGIIEK